MSGLFFSPSTYQLNFGTASKLLPSYLPDSEVNIEISKNLF